MATCAKLENNEILINTGYGWKSTGITKSNHLDDTWLLPSGRIKSDYEDMTFADICRYEEWKHSWWIIKTHLNWCVFLFIFYYFIY